jgi:hypothetical protein
VTRRGSLFPSTSPPDREPHDGFEAAVPRLPQSEDLAPALLGQRAAGVGQSPRNAGEPRFAVFAVELKVGAVGHLDKAPLLRFDWG